MHDRHADISGTGSAVKWLDIEALLCLLVFTCTVTTIYVDWSSLETEKKIYWEKQWPCGANIDYDGTPFIIVGSRDYLCHSGKPVKKVPSVTVCIFICFDTAFHISD